MKAQRDLFNIHFAACEGPDKDSIGPLPAFQLIPRVAPPYLTVIPVNRIRPHPAMATCGMLPKAVQLEPLRHCGDQVFDEPLDITHEGILIDGYKRWKIARELGLQELPCRVHRLNKTEALKRILNKSPSRTRGSTPSAASNWRSHLRRLCASKRGSISRRRAKSSSWQSCQKQNASSCGVKSRS